MRRRTIGASPSELLILRRALLVAVLASVAGAAARGTASGQGARNVYSGPRMEIEPEEHDFGDAEQNQTLVHEFVVRNVGTEELEIRKISTSCGCAAALAEDRVIAPGDQTILKVSIETRRYRGRRERTVSLASNDTRRVLQLRVQVFVQPPD